MWGAGNGNRSWHLILLPLAHVILILSPGVAVQGQLHARDLFPYGLQRMELDVCSPQRLPETQQNTQVSLGVNDFAPQTGMLAQEPG